MSKKKENTIKVAMQLIETAEFIKESMCIDGTVDFYSFDRRKMKDNSDLVGSTFKCIDKKRGEFYITWSLKESK